MISGGTPRTAKLTKRASGVRVNCLRIFSETTINAPAASVVFCDRARCAAYRPCSRLGQSCFPRTPRVSIFDLAGALRANRPPMRFHRERILRFAADLPALGHAFGRQAHAVGNPDILVT